MQPLPRQTGSCRPRRLLPSIGRQASGLPLQPITQFSGRSAPLQPDDRLARASDRCLFDGDGTVLCWLEPALPATDACCSHHTRSACTWQIPGDARGPAKKDPGLHQLPWRPLDRRPTPCARLARAAARLPECATGRLADRSATRPWPRLHGDHRGPVGPCRCQRYFSLVGRSSSARGQPPAGPRASEPGHRPGQRTRLRQRSGAGKVKRSRQQQPRAIRPVGPRCLPGAHRQLPGLPHGHRRGQLCRGARHRDTIWNGLFQ